MNGRTLPWEAAILIPFADEELFVQAEKNLFERGMQFTDEEWKRNTVSFTYPSYKFDANLKKNSKELTSSLKGMESYKPDASIVEFHSDYEKCGQFGFKSALPEGIIYPAHDFPSTYWLDVKSLHYTEKFINKVKFQQLLAVIPEVKEETNIGSFEDWIYDFADSDEAEVYVNFPHQIEAMPVSFEDPFSVYQLVVDQNTGKSKVLKYRQDKDKDCWRINVNMCLNKMTEQGLHVPATNTMVTLRPIIGTEYDELSNSVYKIFSEETIIIPFCAIMKKRSPLHFHNLKDRVNTGWGRLVVNEPAICFNSGLMGIMASIKSVD